MMSRKHYTALAAEVAALDLPDDQRQKVAEAIARVAAADNPRFNRSRFMTAAHAA